MFLSTFGDAFARHGNRQSPLACYVLLCILLHFYAPWLSASEPYLVADINRQIVALGSDIGKELAYNPQPVGFLTVDRIIYFFADDGTHGGEFWRSDGTADGTWLVKDIFPGRPSSTRGFCSVHSDIVSMGSSLYFIANDGTHGLELWKSDGTRSGTVMVKDIHPGPRDSCPFELTEVDGTLFFAADDGVHGSELWRSDGTAKGTFLVKDIDPEGSAIDHYYYSPYFLDLNGVLTFVASTHLTGDNLWRSDGTPDGTYPLVDLATMPPYWSVDRRRTRVVGDELYFFAKDGTLGNELWRTDGTFEGTMRITALDPGIFAGSSTAVAAFGNRLFFQFYSFESGGGLWASDGTEEGTQIVRGGLLPDLLTPVGDLLFFVSGSDALWKSDGTEEGTVEVVPDISPIALTAFGDRLAFAGGRSETGVELWTSDGTAQGTQQVVDLNPGTGHGIHPWDALIQAVDGVLYFTGDDGSTGSELWKSNGTAAGTRLVRNIRPDVGSSSPWQFRNVAGNLFFAANDGVTGVELWMSTGAGARQVRDIRQGSIGSIGTPTPGVHTLSYAVGFFDTLLFSAQDGVHGMELWRSDGTKDGTYLVRDSLVGPSGTFARYLTQVGRQVFFTAAGQSAGKSPLWRTDGTEEGTSLLFDDPPWDFGAYNLTTLNDRLLFRAGFLDGEYQTWRSDGTPEGTEVFLPITGKQYTPVFSSDGDWQMFFYEFEPDTGRELWRTDGTHEGTTIVKDIGPGAASAIPAVGWYPEWSILGTTLYLLADDGVTGLELWKSDGTDAGTQLVKDIRAGEESAFESLRLTPFEAVPMAGVLYFSANDGILGRELWRTDGTASGTYMVIDIVPGPASSLPAYLTTATPCGPLFFAAHNDEHGMEVWRSDGTEEGTYRVSEIQAGYLGSSPRALTVVGSTLFFVATDSATGDELWALGISNDIVVGDHDCNGETTLADFSAFSRCMTGADGWTRPWCEWADFNQDDTVDLYDLARFQAAFGPRNTDQH